MSGAQEPRILFEDGQLLVCVKPRGLRSAADASGKASLPELLAPRQLYPVHRLDLDTLGLMVFAKTPAAAAFLSAQLGNGFCKEYLLLSEGCPAPEEGCLEDLLYHDQKRNKSYAVSRRRAGVRSARLRYRLLARLPEGGSALWVQLETGRTHQIRVQFASRGWPLQGDAKYGARSRGPLQLYAWRLGFRHPDGRDLRFCLPCQLLPPALQFSEEEI